MPQNLREFFSQIERKILRNFERKILRNFERKFSPVAGVSLCQPDSVYCDPMMRYWQITMTAPAYCSYSPSQKSVQSIFPGIFPHHISWQLLRTACTASPKKVYSPYFQCAPDDCHIHPGAKHKSRQKPKIVNLRRNPQILDFCSVHLIKCKSLDFSFLMI